MGSQKTGAIIAVIAGVVLLALALLYWTTPAGSLPTIMPGYEPHSSAHHTKHGLAAFALALFCFVLAWFQTGPKKAL